MPIGIFIAEFKRRRVFRVAFIYGAVGWLVIQFALAVFPALALPGWSARLVVVLVLLGFPIALVLAWAFELTPEGVKLTSHVDRKKKRAAPAAHWGWKRHAIAYLAVTLFGGVGAIVGYRWWQPVFSETPVVATGEASPTKDAGLHSARGQKSVAVLPFIPLSNGEQDGYFADGITEEIINALAQLPELLVTARTSAFQFKGKDLPSIPEIGERLGVDHVLEGSIRREGERVRVTAQLIRAQDGFHLWSENYDRAPQDLISVQDDIARNVAGALDILLDDQKLQLMKSSGLHNVDAFIAFQRGAEFYEKAHIDSAQRLALLRLANREFDEAIRLEPGSIPTYIDRSDLYAHLLMDAAAGMPLDPQSTLDLGRAAHELRANLEAAYQNSQGHREHFMAAQVRSFLSEDWTGLAVLTQRMFESDYCFDAPFSNFFMVFEQPDEAEKFFQRAATCDPLTPGQWLGHYEIALQKGETRLALQRIEAAEQKTGPHPWHIVNKVVAQLALGDFPAATSALRTPELPVRQREEEQVRVLAAKGEQASAKAASEAWLQLHGRDDLNQLLFSAWLGEREKANAAAARIDARPLGPTLLVVATMYCSCGMPFELKATPNFQKRLAEAGFDWSPPTVVKFPAKDW